MRERREVLRMRQAQTQISISTRGQGLFEFTATAARFVRESGIGTGLLTLFVRHTSCSLLVQENADPDVQTDLLAFFRRVVPEGADWFVHTLEGPDDMPAHIRSALTQTSLSVPVANGHMALGTWQGLYLFEHRHAAHTRHVVMHLLGD